MGLAAHAAMLPQASGTIPDSYQRYRGQSHRPQSVCISAGMHERQGQRSYVLTFAVKLEFEPVAQPGIADAGLIAPKPRTQFATDP